MSKTPAKTPATEPVPPGNAAPAASRAVASPASTASRSRAKTAAAPDTPAPAPAPRPSAKKTATQPEPEPMNAAKTTPADSKTANAWKTKAGNELTDAELLAMPESEYMGDKQIEFFRTKLQALKDDLLSNAGETTEHLREDTSIVPDPADRATIEEEHALELRTRDRERKLLKKISQSLARLDTGEYGYCDETGEPIGLGRLLARPTATLSLEAQQRRELKQKMFGD